MANKYKVTLKETRVTTEYVYLVADSEDEVRDKAESTYGENKEYGNGCGQYTDIGPIELIEEDI